MCCNSFHQLAIVRIAGNDGFFSGCGFSQRLFPEQQTKPTRFFYSTMTGNAFIVNDRSNVPVESYFRSAKCIDTSVNCKHGKNERNQNNTPRPYAEYVF